MARDPIPTWYFALVVVRRGAEVLLVQERKHDQLWYVPAGRAEPGESLEQAAVRETLEESGIPIRVTGIIRIEHSPMPDGARVRAVFLAEPTNDAVPKQVPDEHSLQARWVTDQQLNSLPLRGPEVADLMRYVMAGGPVCSLDVLTAEHMPYPQTGGRANEEL